MFEGNVIVLFSYIEFWPAPAMVVEGIHVEDIFELVSLLLSLNISWTFRILAHEKDQYTLTFCL